MKPGIISMIFFMLTTILNAQPEAYKFTHIDINQGLSHNQVLGILKDQKGFLWVGTESGLNRYDGYDLKIFRSNLRDSLSLSGDHISKLFETPDGQLGVLTSNGLNLYDPRLEIFEKNLSSFYATYKIPPGLVTDIVKDNAGNFWFVHQTGGIIHHNPVEKKSTIISHHDNDPASIATDAVTAFAADNKGNQWIVHANGIIEKISIEQGEGKVLYRNRYLHDRNKGQAYNYRLLADTDGDLWIYTSDDQGVFYFNSTEDKFYHLNSNSGFVRLNANIVRSVVEDNEGLIWIGTDHGGINVIDKTAGKVLYITHRDEDPQSLAQNSINTLYKDDEGIIWIGTFKKGLSYFHDNIIRFPLWKHYPLDPSSLPYGDVNRFVEDALGNLWIGTNGGGLIYFDRVNETFRQYQHDPQDPNSLSSNVIVSLCLDHENKLWIGTYYGGLNYFDGKKFIRFRHDPANTSSLSDRSVWEIFEDSNHRLWIGTLSGGLDLYDRKNNTFTHYKNGDLNSVRSNYISAITEDREGNIWIGTSEGLDVLMQETGRFIHYESDPNNPHALSDNAVLDIRQDPKGRIWVGTHGGLNLFDKENNGFRSFTTDHGLPHNSVLTIVVDEQENLWLGTTNGLSNALLYEKDSVINISFRNFDQSDGLQGKQFNENAAFKMRTNELIFGGPDGFNIFDPASIGLNKKLPKVVLSDFQLFNQSIRPGQSVNGRVILPVAISVAEGIVLPSEQDVITFEFAALNFFHPEKNEYKYKLEGFNDDWLVADNKSRKVTFTNLDPGEYTFRVKASNNDGYWNEEGASLEITILPPFWKSNTAFVVYFVLIILGLLITRKIIQQREQLKYAIQQERQEAMRMHELDMMKIKFFTNVSHEFRTPLTLILTPLEKLMKQAKEADQQNQFQLIQRNAKRLLNLVNQLLDFRKLEVQEIKLNPSHGDIIMFIRDTVFSFSDLSEKKDIRLEFNSSFQKLETLFDQDKLEKILFNLLSNAFKFTREHGVVSVEVSSREREGRSWLHIVVKDTGIGIPLDKQDKIFDRFFQNDLPKSFVNQGSGIGLSITREFVKLHGGIIVVHSEPGLGSSFIVELPIHEVQAPAETSPAQPLVPTVNNLQDVEPVSGETGGKPVLLLIEDNEDFRFYLKDNLSMKYRIIEARNGEEGWRAALSFLPDLIVSDIMMPEMNGLELCSRIKTDARVSHIPVILLTARTGEEQKLEGFEIGADDYIGKPFNFEILESRIRNLIARRERMHKAFSDPMTIKTNEMHITSLDEKFLEDAVKSVETNLSNTDFSVEDLSRELGISRAHFYKKIVSLTGKSPLEFIRTIRLQHAARLLEKSQLTVAEIAYQVGFNNPKYFSRYFKEAYHVLPSAYATGQRKKV